MGNQELKKINVLFERFYINSIQTISFFFNKIIFVIIICYINLSLNSFNFYALSKVKVKDTSLFRIF